MVFSSQKIKPVRLYEYYYIMFFLNFIFSMIIPMKFDVIRIFLTKYIKGYFGERKIILVFKNTDLWKGHLKVI